jgi:hypothetical protein
MKLRTVASISLLILGGAPAALAQPAPATAPASGGPAGDSATPAPAAASPDPALAASPPPAAAAPVAPASASTGAPPAPAAPASEGTEHKPAAAEFTSLRLMRDKGIITQAEYESALKDLGETSGLRAADGNTFVLGKWSTTLYGFVEADSIYDTTRSFNDTAGNGLVARPGTQAGDNPRFTMGTRNSRIGFRLRAPERCGIRTSAQLEMDFLGGQAPTASEAALFASPLFRIRHFNLKIETPVVDVLMGQYWSLFGWQGVYHPNTVQIQGIPGELFSRTPQVRISKTLKSDAVTFEVAVAAVRPAQRDAGLPDGQGGIRFALNPWTAVQTTGSTGTNISPASVAVTGYVRRVMVDQYSTAPKYTNDKTAAGLAVDAFLPIIPATKENKDNSLALNGEFATGGGMADQYSALTGGAAFPALPNPTGANPAPVYAPNIDPGIVTYSGAGDLHYVKWTSFLVGAQYYLPGVDGRIWISGNYSRIRSPNLRRFGARAASLSHEDWFDVNLFGDPAPAIRLGLEYANYNDRYVDGTHSINHRVQFSGFYMF